MTENSSIEKSKSQDNGLVDVFAALAMVLLAVTAVVFWVSQL